MLVFRSATCRVVITERTQIIIDKKYLLSMVVIPQNILVTYFTLIINYHRNNDYNENWYRLKCRLNGELVTFCLDRESIFLIQYFVYIFN